MRGSFHKQKTFAERVIAQSQKEWRRGYDAGLASKNPSAWKYFSGSSPSFVDGWKRGQAKRQGEVPPVLAIAPKIDREDHARQEYSRGVFMNRSGMHVSEKVLATCHPEFIRGYRRDILDIHEEESRAKYNAELEFFGGCTEQEAWERYQEELQEED